MSYRSDIPQEGGASVRVNNFDVELRVSTFPTIYGERVSVRLFSAENNLKKIKDIGLSARITESYCKNILSNEGLILVSGPSGSGKTTTLYASILFINESSNNGRSIFTVEDPVENRLSGITQTSINPAAGLDFPKSLSGLLRHDPEVIMLGEVRDRKTAAIATEAALTGHLVLTTIHAPRAFSVPHRLFDMGIEPYGLAGSIRAILNQRLLRRVCSNCYPQKCNENVEENYAGCEMCSYTGFHDRVLIAEYLGASEKLHDAIMDKAPKSSFRKLIKEGNLSTLEEQAHQLVEDGFTTDQEINRVLVEE